MAALTRSLADTVHVGDATTPRQAWGVPIADTAAAVDATAKTVAMAVPRVTETDAAFAGTTQAVLAAPRAGGNGGGALGTDPFGTASFGGSTAYSETDTVSTPRPTGSYPTAEAAERDLAFAPVVLVDDGAFGDAIEDVDRVPVYILKADWGRNGLYDHPLSDLTDLVTEVVVDRAVTGSLPVEVGLVEGAATAQLTVTLEGVWADPDDNIRMDTVDVFAPYRPDAPLYGRPVLRTPIYLETGYLTETGPRTQRRFTGTVTSVNPASGARSVKLTALDPTSSLRTPVTIYGSGLYAETLAAYGPDAYRARINSQWLIDRALRANGIYASPPARPDAILSVTGHGSMIPEVGFGGTPHEQYPTYRGPVWTPNTRFTGATGLLTTVGGNQGYWWATDQISGAAGTGFGFSGWMGMFDFAAGFDDQIVQFDITFDGSWVFNFGVGADGVPYLDAFSTTSHRARAVGYPLPPYYQWQFVGCHVAIGATTFTATFRINGNTYTQTVSYGNNPIGTAYRPLAYIRYGWARSFTNFQVWNSPTPPSGPWQSEDPNFVPQADLDEGVNLLTGIPTMQNVDSWGLIQAVADAEGSIFQFTEDGRPQFLTSKGDAQNKRQHPVLERITADRNLADLVATTDESSIRNIVNVKTKRVLINKWTDYFKATTVDQFDTPPGTSIFDIPITSDVYGLPENRGAIGTTNTLGALEGASFVFYTQADAGGWSGGWNDSDKVDAIRSYIRVCLIDANQPYQAFTTAGQIPKVYIRVQRIAPSLMRLYITNNSNITVRFATPSPVGSDNIYRDGDPALIIPAQLVGPEDAEQVETWTDNASVALYGESSFDVGGSDETWRQIPDGLRSLATEVLATTAHPVPVLDAVDVPHDPRRKIGQRIALADPDGLGEVVASIVALETTYSTAGAMDKITVRPIAPPGLGVLDDPTYGLLDSTLVLGP